MAAQNEQIQSAYDTSHNMWIHLENLDEEGLRNTQILMTAATQAVPNTTNSYYQGLMDGLLWQRYGICPTCNTPHEAGDTSDFEEAMQKKMSEIYARQMVQGSHSGDRAVTPSRPSATEEDFASGTYL